MSDTWQCVRERYFLHDSCMIWTTLKIPPCVRNSALREPQACLCELSLRTFPCASAQSTRTVSDLDCPSSYDRFRDLCTLDFLTECREIFIQSLNVLGVPWRPFVLFSSFCFTLESWYCCPALKVPTLPNQKRPLIMHFTWLILQSSICPWNIFLK